VTITILDGPNAGRTTGTTPAGDYQFDGLAVGNGNVSATHVFYNEARTGVGIDGTSTLNFTLTRRVVGLTGVVENADGGVVAGATVRVVDGPNAGASTGTDSSGVYRLEILAGNTNLVASATGFSEDRRGVAANGTNTLNFRIRQTTPTVSFTATRFSGGGGAVPQEWQFVATVAGSVASSVRNYDWSFGDGTSATETGATEQHVYRVRGTFTVTLTVNLTNGSTLTASKEISTETSDPDSLSLRR
jgi:PKD repeat protein